jgi:hypothetical protein
MSFGKVSFGKMSVYRLSWSLGTRRPLLVPTPEDISKALKLLLKWSIPNAWGFKIPTIMFMYDIYLLFRLQRSASSAVVPLRWRRVSKVRAQS